LLHVIYLILAGFFPFVIYLKELKDANFYVKFSDGFGRRQFDFMLFISEKVENEQTTKQNS